MRSVAILGLVVSVAFLVYVLTEDWLWTISGAFITVCVSALVAGRASRVE